MPKVEAPPVDLVLLPDGIPIMPEWVPVALWRPVSVAFKPVALARPDSIRPVAVAFLNGVNQKRGISQDPQRASQRSKYLRSTCGSCYSSQSGRCSRALNTRKKP